jgi:hypothetical protein
MPKPRGYPFAPLPHDVLEARRVIHEAIDNLTEDETRELAKTIKSATKNILFAGVSSYKNMLPPVGGGCEYDCYGRRL